jgi:hypothetical protein
LTTKPFKKNSPTAKEYVVVGEQNFDSEKQRLLNLVDIFAKQGAVLAEGRKHPFFGKLTIIEWNILTYKHLDHHLQQFGV